MLCAALPEELWGDRFKIVYCANLKMLEWMLLVFILKMQVPVHSASDDEDWSKDVLPEGYSGTSDSTNVSISWELETKGILKLSALEMEFSVDIRMRIAWKDSLLAIRSNEYKVLTKNLMQKIFFPFLEFTNCKACHPLMTDPEKYTFVLNRKEIIHKFRNKVDFNCKFDLSRYPFDVQICQIDIMLTVWGGNVNLSLESDQNEYRELDKDSLPTPSEYLLTDIEVLRVDCKQKRGKRFCFTYKYTFERAVLQHLLVTFVPSILIVMLSWISFWLDVELAAPRVALGQTSLLTLAAQFNNAQRNLPSASRVKALDIWMFVCISLAFASLVEFALAYNFRKGRKTYPQTVQIPTLAGNNKDTLQQHKSREKWFRSRTIDFWAKIVFPLFFLIFNFIFWLFYFT